MRMQRNLARLRQHGGKLKRNKANRTGIMHWRNKRNPTWLTDEEKDFVNDMHVKHIDPHGLRKMPYEDRVRYRMMEDEEVKERYEDDEEREMYGLDFNNQYDMELFEDRVFKSRPYRGD